MCIPDSAPCENALPKRRWFRVASSFSDHETPPPLPAGFVIRHFSFVICGGAAACPGGLPSGGRSAAPRSPSCSAGRRGTGGPESPVTPRRRTAPAVRRRRPGTAGGRPGPVPVRGNAGHPAPTSPRKRRRLIRNASLFAGDFARHSDHRARLGAGRVETLRGASGWRHGRGIGRAGEPAGGKPAGSCGAGIVPPGTDPRSPRRRVVCRGRAGDGRTLYFENNQTFAAYAQGTTR